MDSGVDIFGEALIHQTPPLCFYLSGQRQHSLPGRGLGKSDAIALGEHQMRMMEQSVYRRDGLGHQLIKAGRMQV